MSLGMVQKAGAPQIQTQNRANSHSNGFANMRLLAGATMLVASTLIFGNAAYAHEKIAPTPQERVNNAVSKAASCVSETVRMKTVKERVIEMFARAFPEIDMKKVEGVSVKVVPDAVLEAKAKELLGSNGYSALWYVDENGKESIIFSLEELWQSDRFQAEAHELLHALVGLGWCESGWDGCAVPGYFHEASTEYMVMRAMEYDGRKIGPQPYGDGVIFVDMVRRVVGDTTFMQSYMAQDRGLLEQAFDMQLGPGSFRMVVLDSETAQLGMARLEMMLSGNGREFSEMFGFENKELYVAAMRERFGVVPQTVIALGAQK